MEVGIPSLFLLASYTLNVICWLASLRIEVVLSEAETTVAALADQIKSLDWQGSRAQGPRNPYRRDGNQSQDSDIARFDLISNVDAGASHAILVKRQVTPD